MQYFSLAETRNSAVDKMAVLSAAQLKEQMLGREFLPVALEAGCVAISKGSKMPLDAVPRELFKENSIVRKAALQLGISSVVENFHGEENALAFFAQNRTGQNHFRFESVGGIQERLPTVKSRVSLRADVAFISREKDKECIGLTNDERLLVDLVKSIKRSLNTAVVENRLPVVLAKDFSVKIIDAAVEGQSAPFKSYVNTLLTKANEELANEERQRIIRQFRKAANPDSTPSPD